jgi:organic radical activating enzyme
VAKIPPLRWARTVRAYQRNRSTPHTGSICNAPLTNMYFTVDGQVAPCWLYFPAEAPRWSPERSVADIWRGSEFEEVRGALADGRFIGRCSECRHDIATGNRPLAAAYDNEHPIGEWPTMLEMELSNLCNLECTMCNGQLSSKIRRNREHRPPLTSPYDDRFIAQLEEVVPHLHEVRFNGGEPFLHGIVHEITEMIATINPQLKVTIATNGTVLNDKVRRMLDRCNIHINLSIDSLVPERYEAIRVHSDLQKVMANFDAFDSYCKANDRDLCIMVNPMRTNWMEMDDFVWWTAEREVRLWFNTIRAPAELALHTLPRADLEEIHRTMAAKPLPVPPKGPGGRLRRGNNHVYRAWIDQVATWRDAAGQDPTPGAGAPVSIRGR